MTERPSPQRKVSSPGPWGQVILVALFVAIFLLLVGCRRAAGSPGAVLSLYALSLSAVLAVVSSQTPPDAG